MRRSTKFWAPIAVAAFVVASSGTAAAQQRTHAAATQELGAERPTSEAWVVRRSWDDRAEREYSNWVQTIGRAVAAGRCGSLARCLNDPRINPLWERGRRPLHLHADCADVPYVLRAYFSYRRGLPFVWMADIRGAGRDPRYVVRARPLGTRRWTDFETPWRLLHELPNQVHSGYFRTPPEEDGGDFYQVAVRRGAVRPGTAYYDPNGHVLVVYEITADGEVRMFDGHPDNSLSHPRLSERYVLGTAITGGGFRNFRPFRIERGEVRRVPNAQLPDFGGRQPFDRARWVVGGQPTTFQRWARVELAEDRGAAERAVLALPPPRPRETTRRWPAYARR